MTDEELLEAAAEVMHAYTLTYTGEEDNYFQNLARAALEVFRREQGARWGATGGGGGIPRGCAGVPRPTRPRRGEH